MNTSASAAQDSPATACFPRIVWALVGLKLGLHLLALRNDDWFRDEFYYLACSRRLAWSYVDHPPLSVAVLSALGDARDSFLVVRFLVFFLGCLTLLLASVLTREFGAGTAAQCLTVLALMLSPGFLGLHSFYSMNAWEPLFWLMAAWVWVRIAKQGTVCQWALLSAVFVAGLQNKLSMLWLVLPSLGTAAVFCRHRTHTLSGILFAFAALLVSAAPMVLWQTQHGWPTLEFIANATRLKVLDLSISQFWFSQILVFGPLALILALLGASACLASREWRKHGVVLGASFFATAAMLSFAHGARVYYLAPAYAIAVPVGAAFICRQLRVQEVLKRVVVGVACVLLIAPALVGLPLALPLLSPEDTVRYATWLKLPLPREERSGASELPQHLADRHGWRELAATVSTALSLLPPEIQEQVTIVAANYGEAAALEYHRRHHRLPQRIVSPHNQYWFWARPEDWGRHFVTVGFSAESLRTVCDSVRELARVQCQWCRAGERGALIAYCHYKGTDIKEDWVSLRKFI
ncbi:MAG: glycosyltransferase family 39 protein [Candidatus Binatia bacterium]|nr:glycosyltransferase family 39 protein [Candidatus Binatia bacterium]